MVFGGGEEKVAIAIEFDLSQGPFVALKEYWSLIKRSIGQSQVLEISEARYFVLTIGASQS